MSFKYFVELCFHRLAIESRIDLTIVILQYHDWILSNPYKAYITHATCDFTLCWVHMQVLSEWLLNCTFRCIHAQVCVHGPCRLAGPPSDFSLQLQFVIMESLFRHKCL